MAQREPQQPVAAALGFAGIWALFAIIGMKRRRGIRRVDCKLTTVSAAIRKHGIDRVHLLKVDAEGAERPVL